MDTFVAAPVGHAHMSRPRRQPLASIALAALTVLLGLLVAAMVAPTAFAAAPTVAPHTQAADLAGALAADGTYRGAPGVTGTVDPAAWTLVSDPASGRPPRFAPTAGAASTPIAGPWSALGSNGSGDGALNGWVYAVAVSGADLYVGGDFTNAAGVATADYIAKWNGSAWSALGSDGAGDGAINGHVQAITVSGGDVYVGGRFTDAGGLPTADYIAKWNGSAWSALGSNGSGDGALDNWVQAIAVSGADVYAGGWFENAGGVAAADYVARWNGSTWSGLGSDGSGDGAIAPSPDAPAPAVSALAVSGTDVYVGGSFINVAGIPEADAIARWNGSTWSALGAGSVLTGGGAIPGPGGVYALALSGSRPLRRGVVHRRGDHRR